MKKLPGVSKLMQSIVLSNIDPNSIPAKLVVRERNLEVQQRRWKMMSDLVGHPISSEDDYERAARGEFQKLRQPIT